MGFQRRQKLPQGQIHCFFWAVQRAVGQAFAANRHPKATSIAFYGRPSLPFASPSMPKALQTPKTLQTPKIRKTPKRPHQWHPKARSIAFSGRSSVPFARHLQPTDSQGHINGFFWRPAQAKATPRPDPVLFLGGPACRSPGIRSQRASQGHINGFLWASSAGKSYPKARSSPFSGRSSVPFARHSQPTGIPRPHQWLLMGFQRRQKLPQGQIHCFFWAVQRAVGQAFAANRHSKATSMAFYGRPSLPFASPSMPKTLQTPKTLKPLKGHINGTPRPDPLLFLGGPACRSPGICSQRTPKATSMASYGRPAQAKATPRPDPVLFLGGPACRSPGIRSQRASQGHINGFLWASSAGKSYPKARSIAFSGRSSVPLARHSQPTGIPRPHPALNASKASNR